MTPELTDPQTMVGHVVAGRYRVAAPIGRGGFGAVYRAVEVASGAEVALKVLLAEGLRRPAAVARFRREADLARRLAHPNTVRILDFGVAEDGVPFIAWELLQGRSLEDAIAVAPLAPARVARVAAEVLGSLAEAHGLGIVHRDVKPANVFLCRGRDEPDFVKVLDFGIAKLVANGAGPESSPLTRQGEVPGTPSYMAPEQLTGGALTPAVDLYALGLVMAEALTGQRVFDGDTGMEILQKLISADPVPLAPELRASALGPVIDRATKKRAADRFTTAAEMLEQLTAAARGLPVASTELIQGPAPSRVRAALADTDMARSMAARDTVMPDTEAAPTELRPPSAPTLNDAVASVPPRVPLPSDARPPRSVAVPEQARRRSWLAPLAAALLLLLGGGAAAFWFGAADALIARVASPRAAAPAPTARKIHTRAGNPSIRAMENPAVLQAVLADEGWTVQLVPQPPRAAAGAANCVIAAIEKEGKAGTVMLYRFADEVAATSTETGLRMANGDMQCKRAGLFLLCVTFEGDSRGSRELLAAITR